MIADSRLVRLIPARHPKPANQLKLQKTEGKMSEEQAAAAEPVPEAKEPITLRVRDQTGEETFFKIKKGTKMSKVFSAFAKRKGVQASSLRFLMDGDRVKEDDTPLSLELEDQDMLDCLLEQVGGC